MGVKKMNILWAFSELMKTLPCRTGKLGETKYCITDLAE